MILHLFACFPISVTSVSSSKLLSLLQMHGYTAPLLQWTHSPSLDSIGPLTFSSGICQSDQPLIIGVLQFCSISISKWFLLHNTAHDDFSNFSSYPSRKVSASPDQCSTSS